MAEIVFTFTGQTQDIDDFTDDLFERDSVGTGTQREIPGGGTITMGRMLIRKGADFPRVMEVVLSLGRDVTVGIVAAYLYDKLKGRKDKIQSMTINRREVHLEKGEITKVIEEEIKGEQDEG